MADAKSHPEREIQRALAVTSPLLAGPDIAALQKAINGTLTHLKLTGHLAEDGEFGERSAELGDKAAYALGLEAAGDSPLLHEVVAALREEGYLKPGPPGDPGLRGGPGPRGATGPQGPAGLNGGRGPQGIPGVQGVAGAVGAAGPQGDLGRPGPPGLVGETGNAGATGAQGANGSPGAPGEQGPRGEQGATGPQGPHGDTGATGPQGPPGQDGQDAQFPATVHCTPDVANPGSFVCSP